MAVPLYPSATHVRDCLSEDEIFEIVDRTIRGMASDDVVLGPTEVFAVRIDGVRSRMGSMSGCVIFEAAAGLKWFFVLGNERPRDVPHVPATIIVCDARTGPLEDVMEATFLTAERTAAMGVAPLSHTAVDLRGTSWSSERATSVVPRRSSWLG
ncbi:hypothetical protein [Bradyrhizobium acaciae]|uniref:hypothetical protein n=1 Tax=Bradyrhizobium acaciae TaxID=2683706 RepID=UPI00237B8508|nr:hypothetical protein [Bradyrhizobium acaciae]MCC8982872.1 hypothetical protein [Bradyrhizobium acaciae]